MSEPLNEYQRVAEKSRRDQLVLAHLSMVKHIIRRIIAQLPPGVDVENLEAAGVLGLVESAAKFDPARNAQFKTFAYLRVKGAILDELRRNSIFPQQMLERIAAIRRTTRALPAPVAIADLAQATGMSEDEVAETLAAMRISRIASWDEAAKVGMANPPASIAPPEHELERQERLQLVSDAIDALPERKRQLVTLYYREDLRLKEISAIIGLSESRISRVLTTALFEIQEYIRARIQPGEYGLVAAVGLDQPWQ